MYPVCIQWVLTTMTTLVNRGVPVPCDNKATGLLGYYCYLGNSIEPRTVRNWEQNRRIALRMLKDRGHFYGHNFTKRIIIS